MIAYDRKYYLPYLNKLVYQYDNTYHHSLNKKSINADNSPLTVTNPKVSKFKVNDTVIITKYIIYIIKIILKIGQKKYLR